MIDTHCHILPGVDDGPASVDASLDIAARAAADGIDTIVATPHIIEGLYDGSDLAERVARLQRRIDEEGLRLKLLTGAEVTMSFCTAAAAEVLGKLTIGESKYILMETAQASFEQIINAIYQVQLKGLKPVLAHPERVALIQKHPGQLSREIGSNNLLCQVTASGIEGAFGKTVKKAALALIRLGAARLVATDAHAIHQRQPRLSTSRGIIANVFGEEAARTLFEVNPAKLLDDLPLHPALAGAGRTSKKSFWGKINIKGR